MNAPALENSYGVTRQILKKLLCHFDMRAELNADGRPHTNLAAKNSSKTLAGFVFFMK